MLGIMHLRCDTSHVNAQNVEQVRQELNLFLRRKGYGAIKEIAERAGVHRNTVERFRDGGNVSLDNYDAIRRALGPEPAAADISTRECPHCGESVPAKLNGRTLLFCGNCGEPLGTECEACGHLNTDQKAMFCTLCGKPLTEEAYEAREGLAKITESEKDKAKRKTEERRQRAAERRKRGEPEL